ncbi:MAG TPA: cellulase family glycosylhydrolase [Candidatus Brocadiia bacterium]|nr:cellulase family glycosylhydrolase [Candidatus Brocadiia bacterium]
MKQSLIPGTRISAAAPAACLALLLLQACGSAQKTGGEAEKPRFCRVEGGRLLDGDGRDLILRGINVSGSSKAPPFLPWAKKEDVQLLRKWGFNHVRYLIVWEAVEPQPGVYDDAYLDQVAERLAWCREAGLKVVLDMHQDLYARKYGGDGAPEWACLEDGLPNPTLSTDMWFVNYLKPVVNRCFDNFWANKPGPGGVGLQDRYAAMWQHVARRFRDDTNIVGYDLMNEPHYGSAIYNIIQNGIVLMNKHLSMKSKLAALQLAQKQNVEANQAIEIVKELMRKDVLLKLFDEGNPIPQGFEKKHLQPFTDRIAQAIREVDANHVIFFEPAAGPTSSTRFTTGMDVPKDKAGQPMSNVVFAPHHYDFAADLGSAEVYGGPEFVKRQIGRAIQSAERMGVPVWFGEWGYWTGPANAPQMTSDTLDAFDHYMCGWAYWEYSEWVKTSFVPGICGRPYPEAVAGRPTRISCSEKEFALEFESLPGGGETVIWVPPERRIDVVITLSGGGKAEWARTGSGHVKAICTAGGGKCSVVIRMQ